MLTSVDRQNAARDQRDQGLPPEGAAEGRQERQDQAELGERQVQGKNRLSIGICEDLHVRTIGSNSPSIYRSHSCSY